MSLHTEGANYVYVVQSGVFDQLYTFISLSNEPKVGLLCSFQAPYFGKVWMIHLKQRKIIYLFLGLGEAPRFILYIPLPVKPALFWLAAPHKRMVKDTPSLCSSHNCTDTNFQSTETWAARARDHNYSDQQGDYSLKMLYLFQINFI